VAGNKYEPDTDDTVAHPGSSHVKVAFSYIWQITSFIACFMSLLSCLVSKNVNDMVAIFAMYLRIYLAFVTYFADC